MRLKWPEALEWLKHLREILNCHQCVEAPRVEVSLVVVTEAFLWFEANSW